MTERKNFGISGDAVLLMMVKFMTLILGIFTTRLLSEYLSVYDYGTYSEILLIVSTVSSLTILGMMDGVNYFYSSRSETQKEEYISTIFVLQFLVSTTAGCVVMLLSNPLCRYFENMEIKHLLIFAAALPLLQNLISMFQILLVSTGKAKMLAARNLLVSLIRLAAVGAMIITEQSIELILAATVLLDAGQIVFFGYMLKKNGCSLKIRAVKPKLTKSILSYCVPMAIFIAVNSINRDIDKYIIALFTDTETLAIYANASKILPFDIIMSSFCTVLIPKITEFIAEGEKEKAASLYKLFIEISYISTGILCCAALSSAPQLMTLLYSEKYLNGLLVFCIYVLVDFFRFTNITLVLSAAGKTKKLMVLGISVLAVNTILNFVLFDIFGIIGPAVSTLAVTIGAGILMLGFSAKELETKISGLFDLKHTALFFAESFFAVVVFSKLQKLLSETGLNYFLILVIICGAYGLVMMLLNGKRLLVDLKKMNKGA